MEGGHFTVTDEIRKIKDCEHLKKFAPYIFRNGEKFMYKKGYTFCDMEKEHPTWDKEAAVMGLNRLIDIADKREDLLIDLKTDEGKMIYYPSDDRTCADHRPIILLASGGGYFGVCTLVEAMPVAAKLNEYGYDAMCLNYRSGRLKLFPGVLDDMAEAVRYLNREYIVCGFSAGGHLAGIWSSHDGYKQYHLPTPKAVWLIYPMVSGDIESQAGKLSAIIVHKLMFGIKGNREMCRRWALDQRLSEEYPPTFLCMAKDDDTIPAERYQELIDELNEKKIKKKILYVNKGGHGFGLGEKTMAAGWVKSALEFLGENN